jgi:flagellar transcriptional activator FlhD
MGVNENVGSLNHEAQKLSEEIEALNLSALVLAQNLLKVRREEALFRFGIDEKTALLIEALSIRQLQTIARVPYFLFPFRFDHKVIWEILANNPLEGRSLAHAMIASGGKR